ncbi:KTSC domain-containing protein [Clavibacter michiganensis]|nr:KTSC domain-containing protein [Clavibacter michiganensis]
MNRIFVRSSNLASIGHDAQTGVLEVEFKHGGTYRYFDVPASVFDSLTAVHESGQSVGAHFDLYVKKAGYRYEEL